ncbi:unnamed protein product [Heterobilharzia americana]|nr:unnamed protein product [Heterobilharzia americana]
MIALDNFLINNNTIGEKRVKSTLMSPESTEVPTVTYSKFGTDGRSAAMERSINFLKTQQEAMLKGLHQEIESLKKVNKDLQYRLVMCTCSASDKNLTNVSMEKDEHFLRKEISILQESLENEKRKNAALIKQLEVLQISPSSIKGLPRYKCKDGILSTYPELKTSDVNQRSDQNQDKYGDEIALKDKDAFKKYSDVTMHPHIGINNSSQITTSIPDTSLNKFSSNSSFPIPVKSSLNLSESNLLKRNVIHSFDNECHDKDEKSNKTNGLTGTRLLPIRLPSLNFRKPLIQASLTDQLKTNLPANTTKCSPVNASFEGENINQSKTVQLFRTLLFVENSLITINS